MEDLSNTGTTTQAKARQFAAKVTNEMLDELAGRIEQEVLEESGQGGASAALWQQIRDTLTLSTLTSTLASTIEHVFTPEYERALADMEG